MKKRAADLQPGDLVDLEGDNFADNGEHPEFEFELQEVAELDRETPGCLAVYFSNFACGFPPDHLLEVPDYARPQRMPAL